MEQRNCLSIRAIHQIGADNREFLLSAGRPQQVTFNIAAAGRRSAFAAGREGGPFDSLRAFRTTGMGGLSFRCHIHFLNAARSQAQTAETLRPGCEANGQHH